MIRSFLISVLCVLGFLPVKATDWVIDGEFIGSNEKELSVILYEFSDGRYRPLDSTKTQNNRFSFEVKNGEEGFYQVEWKIRRPMEIGFVLSELSPHVSLRIDPMNVRSKEVIQGVHIENDLLGRAAYIQNQGKKFIHDVKDSYHDLSTLDPNYYENKRILRDSAEVARARINERLKALIEENPTSYVARCVIPLMIKPSLTEPEFAKKYDGMTSLMHYHFFDHASLNDPALLRSPELKEQLQDYLNEFSGRKTAAQTRSVDYLLGQSEEKAIRSFIIRLAYLFFVAKEELEVLAHIRANYFRELSSDHIDALNERSANLYEVRAGKDFKDFSLKDCNCPYGSLGDAVEMNRATLLVFWSYECGSCEEELENLKLLYNEFHDRGFEIVAINVNPDAEKWHAVISEMNYPWIHQHEPNGFSGPVPKTYSVQKTPTNYFILSNGVIKGHDQSAVELKRILSQIL